MADASGLDGTLRELRHAVRALRRSPGFACAVVGVLGLGAGAATAAYGVARAVLLAPLPYGDEARLVSVYETDSAQVRRRTPSWPTVREWSAATASFEALAYVRGETFAVRNDEGTLLLLAAYSTQHLFGALAAEPALGRTFDAEEARSGAPVAVLAWHLWREQFGGDPDMVGATMSTAAGPLTVIGVMPEGVRWPAWADLWLPQGLLSADGRAAIERRDLHVDALTVGRLAPGATVARAAEELHVLNEQAAQVHPDTRGWTHIDLRSVRSEVLGDAGGRVALLAGATALLLLIACVNVAGLLVARAAARDHELSVRAALGASRHRLTGQLLAESALLAAAGGLVGILFASLFLRALAAGAAAALPRLGSARVDPGAFAFALGISAATALLVSLLPARRATRVAPMDVLRSARGSSRGPAAERVRATLVVAEIALATVLVVGAGSLLATLLERMSADLGFDPSGIVTLRVQPPSPRYDSPAAARALYERLETTLEAVPGVAQATLVNHLPLSGTSMPTDVRTSRAPGPDERPWALYRAISADYFDTLRIGLIAGRAPTPQEVTGGAPVVLVNASFAEREWPGESALGRSITMMKVAQGRADFGDEMTLSVIGVVPDLQSFGPGTPEPAVVYAPWTLALWTSMFVAVRSGSGDPASILAAVRATIADIDPAIPVAGPGFNNRVRPLEDYAANLLQPRRLGTALLSGFALASLVLAAVGLFGVLTYLVVQRRRELGVRAALGATRASLIALVLRRGGRLVGIGLVAGFTGSWLLARVLDTASAGIAGVRPSAFVGAALLFGLAGLLACLLPALRAARVAPARILREDG